MILVPCVFDTPHFVYNFFASCLRSFAYVNGEKRHMHEESGLVSGVWQNPMYPVVPAM